MGSLISVNHGLSVAVPATSPLDYFEENSKDRNRVLQDISQRDYISVDILNMCISNTCRCTLHYHAQMTFHSFIASNKKYFTLNQTHILIIIWTWTLPEGQLCFVTLGTIGSLVILF
jgi:hypothetical protein